MSLKQQKTNNTCSENIAKQNKHKARVAKARAGKQNFSKSSGGAPGINTRVRLDSRALFYTNTYLGVFTRVSGP